MSGGPHSVCPHERAREAAGHTPSQADGGHGESAAQFADDQRTRSITIWRSASAMRRLVRTAEWEADLQSAGRPATRQQRSEIGDAELRFDRHNSTRRRAVRRPAATRSPVRHPVGAARAPRCERAVFARVGGRVARACAPYSPRLTFHACRGERHRPALVGRRGPLGPLVADARTAAC